jgi:hypothetical protein
VCAGIGFRVDVDGVLAFLREAILVFQFLHDSSLPISDNIKPRAGASLALGGPVKIEP